MNLLDPTYFHTNCDYSFGDQSGYQNGIVTIKNANVENFEFLSKVQDVINSGKNYMTLFIDNIRLYKRDNIKYTAKELVDDTSRKFKDDIVKEYFSKNDLLDLCSQIKEMNFIIFTGFEDTPIDDEIFDKIPENVLSIFASNAISFRDKVVPIPYGIKRKMNGFDNSQEILKKMINSTIEPTKMVYLNFSITNPNREIIIENLKDKSWVTFETNKLNYLQYLNEIKNHKYVICPDGNAIGCECHRDWETIYMRRIPVVLDTEYLRNIFKNIPVLFVKDFTEITEELLLKNEYLLDEINRLDFNVLDIKKLYNKCVLNSIKLINQ
jgi:hypothetical protein